MGSALKWFKSYLQGRCQRVKIGGTTSCDIIIKFGVPQGSVLGPILFNLYIRSIYRSVQKLTGFNIFGFADDHQLFKSFHLENEYQILSEDLPDCFQIINDWMSSHFLQLNPGKTEVIVIGKEAFLSKLKIQGTFIMPGVCYMRLAHAHGTWGKQRAALGLVAYLALLHLHEYFAGVALV